MCKAQQNTETVTQIGFVHFMTSIQTVMSLRERVSLEKDKVSLGESDTEDYGIRTAF